jgi:hypothetical protein
MAAYTAKRSTIEYKAIGKIHRSLSKHRDRISSSQYIILPSTETKDLKNHQMLANVAAKFTKAQIAAGIYIIVILPAKKFI